MGRSSIVGVNHEIKFLLFIPVLSDYFSSYSALVDFVSSAFDPDNIYYIYGRVVTRWPGSQEVGGSIPGCATKFVRCKNLAFNIGECVSRGSDTT